MSHSVRARWIQLVLGLLCMMSISSPQYIWTLFTKPLAAKPGVTLPQTGIVYVGVVGLVVRWFPEKRGFAAGIAAAGYGMGAIVTTFPIAASLARSGVESTLWTYGIVFAVVGSLAAQVVFAGGNRNDSVADSAR